MNIRRLLATTAVRLALRYTLVYLVVLGVALGLYFWSVGTRLDEGIVAELEQELATLTTVRDRDGGAGLGAAIARRLAAAPDAKHYYLLQAGDGSRVTGNVLAWPDEYEGSGDGTASTAWFDEAILPEGHFDDDALLPVIDRTFADGSRLLLARGVAQTGMLNDTAELLVEVLGAAVLLGMLMSIVLGRIILRRMDTISETAGEIMAGDLSRRIPLSGRDDEFDALAGQLNRMLDRIQLLIRGIREVTDNIAHDLRSPLNRLRSRLEITRMEERSPQEYRDALTEGIRETESLIRTFNALLSIAQAESGNHRSEWGAIDLDALAGDLADLYAPAAEDRQQHLEFVMDDGALIRGSRDLLAQAIGNLLENAIKFTPAGGSIRLQVRQDGNRVDIIVSDTGPGIPAAERDHVLERFVRLEGARNTPGNGLGLSLVRAVAGLHGAELLLADAAPGLVVTLRFPKPHPRRETSRKP